MNGNQNYSAAKASTSAMKSNITIQRKRYHKNLKLRIELKKSREQLKSSAEEIHYLNQQILKCEKTKSNILLKIYQDLSDIPSNCEHADKIKATKILLEEHLRLGTVKDLLSQLKDISTDELEKTTLKELDEIEECAQKFQSLLKNVEEKLGCGISQVNFDYLSVPIQYNIFMS